MKLVYLFGLNSAGPKSRYFRTNGVNKGRRWKGPAKKRRFFCLKVKKAAFIVLLCIEDVHEYLFCIHFRAIPNVILDSPYNLFWCQNWTFFLNMGFPTLSAKSRLEVTNNIWQVTNFFSRLIFELTKVSADQDFWPTFFYLTNILSGGQAEQADRLKIFTPTHFY